MKGFSELYFWLCCRIIIIYFDITKSSVPKQDNDNSTYYLTGRKDEECAVYQTALSH